MGTIVSLNGTNYTIPATGEGNWGAQVTAYLVAIASGVLQKTGGSFTLTAEVDFGATYGLKSAYVKSRNTPSTTGVFRLGNNESVAWRNAANSADKLLKVNTGNILEYDGNPLLTLALGAADTVLRMNAGATAYEFAKITNANIDASAAIDATKIAAGTVNNTVFGYLAGVSSSIQTQLNAKLDDVATANNNEIPRFDTNGQALQNSKLRIDDNGYLDTTTAQAFKIGETNATDITIGRSGQIVYFAGNVIVQGDYVYENVSDMQVEDKNILVNRGGTTVGAAGAGISVEGDAAAVIATILFDNSLTSKWKLGATGAESEILTAAAIQSISGVKTFTDNLIIDNAKEIRFRESTGSGTNYIGFKASSTLSADKTFVLPTGDGTSNQVLKTDGAGNLSWATVAAGIGTNFDVYEVSADYTVLDADGYRHIIVTTSSTNRTITLPTAADNADRMISVYKVDSGVGVVIVDGEGSETINGATTFTLSKQWDKVTLVCNGTSWNVVEGSLATSSHRGLVKGGEVPGDTSGSAISSANIGQVISSVVSSSTFVGSSGGYWDATSITLTPGNWLISGVIMYDRNGATLSSSEMLAGLSVTSGNSAVGLSEGINLVYFSNGSFPTTFNKVTVVLNSFIIRYDGTTITLPGGGTLTPTSGVVYLKGGALAYTVANPYYKASLLATRIG